MTSRPPDSYDVAIIGGGPASSAAAGLLASWGHSVVLLARGPTRDAIAESLPPSAAKLLDKVGVLNAVNSAGFLRAAGNTVRWGTQETQVESFPNGTLGWQLDRASFDRTLLAAAERAGARIIANVNARDLSDPDGDGVRAVKYDSEDERLEVKARWVLDCTGRSGLIARRGWRTPRAAARTLAIVGVWSPAAASPETGDANTVVESFDDGWAWSIPTSLDKRYVTVMIDPAHTAVGQGDDLAATYRMTLRRTRAMRELVKGLTMIDAPLARDASPYGFWRAGADGLLLVGDAASFIDPLSSFGVKKALASGWLAAVVARAASQDSGITPPALDLYEQRERDMHDQLQRRAEELARDVAAVHERGFWGDRTGAGAVGDEPDVSDAEVARIREAFEEIRQRPRVSFRRGRVAELHSRAVVRGRELVILPHLVTRASPTGVRFVRNVDVVELTELAPSFDQVPDLFEAYNQRTKSRAELSDFLAALATLVATGALELGPSE